MDLECCVDRDCIFIPFGSLVIANNFIIVKSFPGGSDGKESACNGGDAGLIPGLGRSPGIGTGNPHRYSCLENSTD